MKNKTIYLFLIILFFVNPSYSQDEFFIFETKNIEITDNGNLINANYGKAISKDNNLEILADNFQYNNSSGILDINGNGLILVKKKNLKIRFNDGTVDPKNFIFDAFGEIEIENLNRNLKIQTEKLKFNYKEDILLSDTKSLINDDFKNELIADKFHYQFQKDLLKIQNLKFTDNNNNILELSTAYVNTKTNNLFGKDVSVKLDNKTLNKKNEPRLKGNSLKNNETSTEIIKGVFTTCKKRDGCPPWELSANKILHDKKEKKIKYDNATLRIYDYPIVYFPKFFHPDPTVNRQSGFLTPTIKNTTNKKNFLSLPYYMVISDHKDITFSPRFYNDEQLLLQTEYRSVGYKSDHISDFSFKIDDYKKIKSHFFYKYDKSFNLDNFINNSVTLNIQHTTKDTFLKKNKIKSKLGVNDDILENSAKINFSKDDMLINFETTAYENLNKKESDRYEYIFPKVDLIKNIDNKTKLNGDFVFYSQILNKNYNTNIMESININDLRFNSFPKVTRKGIYNNYEFIIKNSNTNAKNSKSFKNKESSYVSGLVQFNSSLPLSKSNKNYTKLLNPKLALKIAPNYTKDYRNKDNKIDINNIYSLERNAEIDTIEGGLSIAYGSEYSVINKKNSLDVFNFKIANNLRLNENNDLPRNSQIDEKISSILNEVAFQPNELIKINYKSSIKNNFDDINYENFITELKINNLVTSFDYYNQNESYNKYSYLTNTTQLQIDEFNSLSFSTRKNKTKDLTEYYKLSYQYKNDCLLASIEYNKEYYSDRDVKPDEGIFLKLTIIPFNKEDY